MTEPLTLNMEELSCLQDAFTRIEDGDSVMYMSASGIHDEATVRDNTGLLPERGERENERNRFVFGRPESGVAPALVFTDGSPRLAEVTKDGLMTRSEIRGLINHTQGYYAGEIEDGYIESAEASQA